MRREEHEEQHRRAGFFPELIFAWRTRRHRIVVRMLVSVFAAALGFVALGALVRIEGRPAQDTALRQGTAGVVILRGDDAVSRDLIQWAREQSPDVVTWQPAVGGALAEAMLEVENEIRSASRYRPRLQPAPERATTAAEDPVSSLIAPALPPVDPALASHPAVVDGAFPVRPVFTVSGELRERWREPQGDWAEDDLRKLVSREAVFSLAVNEEGAVEFCLPMRGTETGLDGDLRRRLRAHSLKPEAGAGLQWGTVTVRIEAGSGEEETP